MADVMGSSNLIPQRARPRYPLSRPKRPQPRTLQTVQFKDIGEYTICLDSPTPTNATRDQDYLSTAKYTSFPNPERSLSKNHFLPNTHTYRMKQQLNIDGEVHPRRRPAHKMLTPIRTTHMQHTLAPMNPPLGLNTLRRYGSNNAATTLAIGQSTYDDISSSDDDSSITGGSAMWGVKTQRAFGKMHEIVVGFLWKH